MCKRTSAVSSARWVRSMPWRSTRFCGARRPAVSNTRSAIPRRLIRSSMKSRVVPCTSLTIARSNPSMRLSRLDLPALVAPKITTRNPSRKIRPVSAVAISLSMSLCSEMRRSRIVPVSSGEIPSSGKSIEASTWAMISISRCCNPRNSSPNRPRNCSVAERNARSVCARIRSMTASAWVRSILPLR